MISFPNAKVNLGLSVLQRLPDGYHTIESVFLPVSLADALEIFPSKNGELEFQVYGNSIPGDKKDNLIIKAWNLLKKYTDVPPVEIHLLKNIPMGAGLGGGSADGAFMLKMLNDYFQLSLSSEDLKNLAGTLGSDCPFFIDNQTRHVSGTGKILQPVDINLKGYFIGIVYSGIHVGTAEAYNMVKPTLKEYSILERLVKENITTWKDWLINDFEDPVFKKYPLLKDIKQKFYSSGAVYSSMTGSGSAVYGIFREFPDMSGFDRNHFIWSGKI